MLQGKDLSDYRLDQAVRCLKSAKMLLSDDDFKGAANRSYYCVFHSMRSVLALSGIDFKSHAAVISHFRKEYVKTKIFDTKMSDILTVLFRVRNESDYEDFYLLSKEEVVSQLESAEFFINEVRRFLSYPKIKTSS